MGASLAASSRLSPIRAPFARCGGKRGKHCFACLRGNGANTCAKYGSEVAKGFDVVWVPSYIPNMNNSILPGGVGKDCLRPKLYTNTSLDGCILFTLYLRKMLIYTLDKIQGGGGVNLMSTDLRSVVCKGCSVKIRFAIPAITFWLALAFLSACDKGKPNSKEDPEQPNDTVWTWDLCTTVGWDTTDDSWHPCDSLLYLDVRAACEWETADSFKAMYEEDVAKWRDNVQYWRGLKKLSPRIKEIYFTYSYHFEESPNLTELPPEIWEIPHVWEFNFYRLPMLKALPDITKPNQVGKIVAYQVPFTFPKGLGFTEVTSLDWALCKMEALPNSLQEINHQLLLLRVWSCDLKAIPEWLLEFENLWSVKFGFNDLVRLPTRIGKLSQVDVSDNQIDSMPESVCDLEEHQINLSDNKLCNISAWPSCYDADSIQQGILSQNCN